MPTESQWETTNIQLPDTLTDLAAVLNDLIGMLIAILDVVLAVLGVVKAFLIGFLDPLSALIKAIIDEIEGLLNDIRQIGVYITGDFEVEPPFNGLLGGFSAYERRMMGRLLDRNDPTRPAFSSRSQCVAIFTYFSFDTTTIQLALAFISQIRKFFGLRGKTRTFTIPTGLSVSYGAQSTGLGAFGLLGDILAEGEAPSVANLRWQMAPPAGAGKVSWPVPAPPGFLVEVSTVPDGLALAYLAPVANEQSVDRVEMGLVSGVDGKPFKLYGGTSILKVDPSLAWSASGTTYTAPKGDRKTRLFAYQSAADNVPIPLDALQIDGKHLLQRTFFVDTNTVLGINIAAPGQPFSTRLKYEDMPYGATFESNEDGVVTVTVSDEPARDVYVRVSAVTSHVAGLGDTGLASNFAWTLSESSIQAGVPTVVQLAVAAEAVAGGGSTVVATSDKSASSAALKLTFPSELTSEYLECVATALLVMTLSRSDLVAQGVSDASFQVDVAAQETGLEDLAQYLVPFVLGNAPGRFLKRNFPDVTSFRGSIRRRCMATANMLLAKTGPLPSSVLDLVIEQASVTLASGTVRSLSKVTWKDLNSNFDLDTPLLQSLDPSTPDGSDASIGLAANPVSAGKLDADFLGSRIGGAGVFGITLARAPGFMVPPYYARLTGDTKGEGLLVNMGSADYSPVVYSSKSSSIKMQFCRNLFLSNPSILAASKLVLNVAASTMTHSKTSGGSWINYRLFPQGLPPVEAALNEIVAFLDAIAAGLKGILDAIIAYIEYIEARILELEALLRRIQGLLDMILSIEVPAMAALVVTAAGTDGILQSFMTAGNKPSDSSAVISRVNDKGNVVLGGAYGTGVLFLAGGLPTSVLELFLLIFPPAE